MIVHRLWVAVGAGSIACLASACDAGQSSGGGSCSAPSADAPNDFEPIAPQQAAVELGRGINLGNMFDAPHNGDWNAHYDPDYIDLIKNAGFSHVRLPVRWSNHAALSADATLEPGFACQIDAVLDLALSRDLYVVMDMHHYRQLDGDDLDGGEAAVDPSVLEQRFVNLWRQIAARYHTRSNKLVYELYNEPHRRLGPSEWNALYPQALAAVRESDPERLVMLGATSWYAAGALNSLELPSDPNLILTVHDYDPVEFTFQGTTFDGSAAWVGTTCCSDTQRQQISMPLDVAFAFARQVGYPMYLGEFGSSLAADDASRAAYSRFMRDEAEARAMPWAVWSLVDLGIYDTSRRAWREGVKDALLGP